jgi:hypothetical protein
LFAKVSCTAAVFNALACAVALVVTSFGGALPEWIFAILFVLTIFSFLPVIYVNRKMLADSGDWFGSGIYSLLRYAPIWLIALCAASLVNAVIAEIYWSDIAAASAFFLLFNTISATLMFLVFRNSNLVWGGLCANGHSTKHFNRFCPVCGELLSRRNGPNNSSKPSPSA